MFINHFPKIDVDVLRKIAIDVFYFWDIFGVTLWEKNYSRRMAYKAEAVFPIMYFSAEAVIGGVSQK